MTDLASQTSGLARAFHAQRPRLRAIAYRVLGSYWDADDAVQETWIRLDRTDAGAIENLEAWLTTVVSRVSIDILRGRGAPRDELDDDFAEVDGEDDGPEHSAVRIDEIGAAMLVVLEQLSPLERLSFVLHDIFALSFDDIAPIVERTPVAARQLASRARRRVRLVDLSAERTRSADAVTAFLKAARDGDFGDLLQLLDPDVRLRADSTVVTEASAYADAGAPLLGSLVGGADAVARVFAGRAAQAHLALIDGWPGAVYAPGGRAHAVYIVRFRAGRIAAIEVIGDPAALEQLRIDA
jgi:RNA polymerase sigma-70 factor (ECF subfamily)